MVRPELVRERRSQCPDETHSARLAWGTGGMPTFEAPAAGDQRQLGPVEPDAV